MLTLSIEMIAAALASNEPVTLPFQKRYQRSLAETAEFLRRLSAEVTFDAREKTMRVVPVAQIPWYEAIHDVPVTRPDLFWLYVGVVVKMNLAVGFRPTFTPDPAEVAAVRAAFPKGTSFFWRQGEFCVISLVQDAPLKLKPVKTVPVSFAVGLLLGSVLGFGWSDFRFGSYYAPKKTIKCAHAALLRFNGNPGATVGAFYRARVLVRAHTRRDFGYFDGVRLVTEEDWARNQKVYWDYVAAIDRAYKRYTAWFLREKKRKHDEKIRKNREEKKRKAREGYLAELAREREEAERAAAAAAGETPAPTEDES